MSLAQLPISFVEALAIGKQSRAGALGLLMYDYLITFDLEVDVVWKQSKRSPLCWLYLFNRFFPLVWLILDLIPFVPGGIASAKICIIYLAIDDFVIVVSTLAVQVILQLRVYALYQKSRRVRLFLIFSCLAEITVMAIFIGITLANIKGLPVISTNNGCYYTGIFSISAFFWLPALVYEPILFLMVLWKAREDWLDIFRGGDVSIRHKGFRNPGKLVKALAQDSLIYFVGIFIELVINTVIWAHYSRYINVVVPWSGALPSILGSRLFLRMREAILFPERYGGGLSGVETSGIVSQSTVKFSQTHRPVSIWTRQADGRWVMTGPE